MKRTLPDIQVVKTHSSWHEKTVTSHQNESTGLCCCTPILPGPARDGGLPRWIWYRSCSASLWALWGTTSSIQCSTSRYDEITSFLCCRYASTSSVHSVQSKCPAEWRTSTKISCSTSCFCILWTTSTVPVQQYGFSGPASNAAAHQSDECYEHGQLRSRSHAEPSSCNGPDASRPAVTSHVSPDVSTTVTPSKHVNGRPTDGRPANGRPTDVKPTDGRPTNVKPTDGWSTYGRPTYGRHG